MTDPPAALGSIDYVEFGEKFTGPGPPSFSLQPVPLTVKLP
jgi:hypothetical protein